MESIYNNYISRDKILGTRPLYSSNLAGGGEMKEMVARSRAVAMVVAAAAAVGGRLC